MEHDVHVLYVTFRRDFKWLDYSLQSFQKYASGFKGVSIVVPTSDYEMFLPYVKKFSTPECPVSLKTFMEFPQKGFLHHLAMKCYGDVLCPKATHVLHMDPDCLFSKPVTPDDYFVDGKPVLVIEPYSALPERHPGRYNWKKVTEFALRFECEYETMCRHPAVHEKWVYKKVRSHIEREHETPFLDFVLKQQNKFPQGFGEFNTIGAWVHKFAPDFYHFIDRGDLDDKNDPPSKLTQMWSYQGTDANWAKIKKILQ
jgi:hypothetical protein